MKGGRYICRQWANLGIPAVKLHSFLHAINWNDRVSGQALVGMSFKLHIKVISSLPLLLTYRYIMQVG